MKINVKGNIMDVESVDGNVITLVSGQKIEVSDKTLESIQSQMKKPSPLRRRRA